MEKTKEELEERIRELERENAELSSRSQEKCSVRDRETVEMLASIVDNSDNIAVLKDLGLRYLHANNAYLRLTGFQSVDDVIGKTDEELFADMASPGEIEEYMDNDRKALSVPRGEVVTREETIGRGSDEERTFYTKKFPVYSEEGSLEGIGTISTEVTSLKKAQEELRKSEEEKRAIIEGLEGVVIEYVDKDMNILWVNRTITDIFDAPLSEIVGQPCYKIVQGLDEPCPDCTAVKSIKSGRVEEGEVDTPDGRHYVVRSTPIYNQEELEGVVHIATNVTDIKESEERYRELSHKLQAILDGMPYVVGLLNPDRTVIKYNSVGYDFLGLCEEDAVGKKCYNLIGRESSCDDCTFEKAVSTKEMQIGERYIPEKDIYLECRSNPILDEEGNVEGVVEILTDITDRKKAEEQMKKNERLQTAIEFAGALSHELNNPLTGVIGYSEMLAQNYPDHPAADKLVKMGEQCARIAKIVRALDSGIKRYQSQEYLPGGNIMDILGSTEE